MTRFRRAAAVVCALVVVASPAAVLVAESPATATTKAGAKPGAKQKIFVSYGARLGDGTSSDTAAALAVSKGRTFVVGTKRTGSASAPGDVVVARYAGKGRLVWKRTVSAPGDQAGVGVAAAGASPVVLAGTDDGFWVRRYRKTGVLLWKVASTDLGITGVQPGGIAVVGGSVYVVGATSDTGGGPSAGVVVKLSRTTGALEDSRVDDTVLSWTGVAQTGTNLVVAGSALVGSPASRAIAVSRINARTLATRWSHTVDTALDEEPTGVAAFRRRIYVSGSTQATLSGQTSSGGTDFVLASFMDYGRPTWYRQFGTAANDAVAKVAVTPDGPIVVGTLNRPGSPVDSRTTDYGTWFFNLTGALRETRRDGGSAYDGVGAIGWNYHGLRVLGTTRSTLYGKRTGTDDVFLAGFSVKISPRHAG